MEINPAGRFFFQKLIVPGTIVLPEAIDSLREENEALRSKCEELQQKVDEDAAVLEQSLNEMKTQYEEKVADLLLSNKQIKKLSDNLSGELDQWKESYKTLIKKYKDLKEEKESLEHTKDYFKNMAEGLKTVPVNEIMNHVLDYMTTLYNASFDKENAEVLRNVIVGRTEYLAMVLESTGITVLRHNRDSVLGNERVDIEVKITDNPEMDCKVIRSEHFGCYFKNDQFAMIPERVTVYRYQSTEGETETISDQPQAEVEKEPVQETDVEKKAPEIVEKTSQDYSKDKEPDQAKDKQIQKSEEKKKPKA